MYIHHRIYGLRCATSLPIFWLATSVNLICQVLIT
jgi:hypothetical protein